MRVPGRVRTLQEQALGDAQEMVYDAWETSTRRQRVALARRALALSPDCADAYVLLAQETARTPEEERDLYAEAVAAGERALGPKAFIEDVGHFWGLLETRPYMRARASLAQSLWALAERDAAVAHYWELLRLNPGDNQGIRYLLAAWLLELGRDDQLAKLLGRYDGEGTAAWLYTQALAVFRQDGEGRQASQALRTAARCNPHVPAYLLGSRRLPLTLPDAIGFGDESEAVHYAADFREAWRWTPGALEWLARARLGRLR